MNQNKAVNNISNSLLFYTPRPDVGMTQGEGMYMTRS